MRAPVAIHIFNSPGSRSLFNFIFQSTVDGPLGLDMDIVPQHVAMVQSHGPELVRHLHLNMKAMTVTEI